MNLTLWFFPEFICSMLVLQNSDSWAPLFRYQFNMRLRRALGPNTAVLEAESARRIAWQASFTQLRRLNIHFDFSLAKDQLDRRHAVNNIHFLGACCDQGRAAFIRMLELMETAFPNLEEVDVQVWHVICSGHMGRWSSKTGLQKAQQGCYGRRCSEKCPQMIGEVLQAAMVRGRKV
ncbi:uncharacterized protein CC84DRAFT_760316 [Paraphaeosphaeria sporulosa]|uniref:Uncharacterized protein n=1 Tax=Paraphaeosphaeria sporulosa TaxID=1460663 RepID=A0A177CGG4_9PLEO|nr:uncharacterized protein CC84DRAFT_760316 [Paraphaeosphaeria sporulosa]OAG06311.1 hypothetical protein CC84DRAFT_760316 [Paraphaeosphaeria sporulosa]